MPLCRLPGPRAAGRRAARSAATALAVTGLAVTGLAACSGDAAPGSQEGDRAAPRFVVTTPILGSIASMIVTCAGQGTIEVLMPNGTDPHDFAPSSAQVADLVTADLVIANGLGLEAGMAAALASAMSDGARIWEVGPEVDPIPFANPPASANPPADEHAHGTLDPHIWFDMSRMAKAATSMGEQMQEASPPGIDADFSGCGRQASAQITTAQDEVRSTLATIPAERRILVTDHEALGYLANAYGFEIAGAVIPSTSTLAEPSSADLAQLAALIRNTGVRAIFANVSQPTQLADAVAAESGTEVAVVPLYIESLGEPGTPAADYIGMMRQNASLIASGLGS